MSDEWGDDISEQHINSIRKVLLMWGKTNYKDFPWRRNVNKWHALIAEVLLQRTRARAVVSVYDELAKRYIEPAQLASAPLSEIEEVVYSLGLPARASTLKSLAEEIVKRRGKIPLNVADLTKLPGVGAYIAAAWLSFHANKRAVIVDANVVRWICRLVGRQCNAETRRKKWLITLADKLTPVRNVKDYNYAVLDFTMEICGKKPLCEICPLGPKLCIHGRKILLP